MNTPAGQPAQQRIGRGLPENVQHGASFSREPRTNVGQVPGASRSGALPPGESVRTIRRRPPDGTNARTVDRSNIDQSVYANRYGR
jgi:hypothetical protein